MIERPRSNPQQSDLIVCTYLKCIFVLFNIFTYYYIIYSWPCLHQWLETRPTRQVCPVCKAAISKEKVIPLYGRGATKHEDPRFVVNLRSTVIFVRIGKKKLKNKGN